MEAVLRPASKYAELFQREKTVIVGLSRVHILSFQKQLDHTDAYKLVNFGKQWDCKKTFDRRGRLISKGIRVANPNP